VLMGTGSWFGTSKSGLVGRFVNGVNIRNGLTYNDSEQRLFA
jgi:hypothetical protein